MVVVAMAAALAGASGCAVRMRAAPHVMTGLDGYDGGERVLPGRPVPLVFEGSSRITVPVGPAAGTYRVKSAEYDAETNTLELVTPDRGAVDVPLTGMPFLEVATPNTKALVWSIVGPAMGISTVVLILLLRSALPEFT
jgi:hypothetical protein